MHRSLRFVPWLTVVVLVAGLAASGGRPLSYSQASEDRSEGPGLFSGEDGEFVITRAR